MQIVQLIVEYLEYSSKREDFFRKLSEYLSNVFFYHYKIQNTKGRFKIIYFHGFQICLEKPQKKVYLMDSPLRLLAASPRLSGQKN